MNIVCIPIGDGLHSVECNECGIIALCQVEELNAIAHEHIEGHP